MNIFWAGDEMETKDSVLSCFRVLIVNQGQRPSHYGGRSKPAPSNPSLSAGGYALETTTSSERRVE
jgi:hypothetical protein